MKRQFIIALVILIVVIVGIIVYLIISNIFDVGTSNVDSLNEDLRGEIDDLFNHTCDADTYNCGDFTTQEQAQNVHDECGAEDIHRLDSDGDGIVCENLP